MSTNPAPWSRRLSLVVAIVMIGMALAIVGIVVLLGRGGEAALQPPVTVGTTEGG